MGDSYQPRYGSGYGRSRNDRDRYAPPSPPGHRDQFTFRGVADRQIHDRRGPDSHRADHYQPDRYYRRPSPPRRREQEEFSFRAPSGPTFPSHSRSDRQSPPPRRNARTGQNERGGQRAARGHANRKKPPFRTRAAHARAILTNSGRETTPERLEGMDTTGATRFVDYISSDDESTDEDDEPARKKARVSPDTATTAPKWSNPDPYTALPPPESLGAPKKDIVQVIRKAKIDAGPKKTDEVKTNLDFISLDDDDDGEQDETVSVASAASVGNVPPPTAPKAPKQMIQASNGLSHKTTFTPIDPSELEYAALSEPPRSIPAAGALSRTGNRMPTDQEIAAQVANAASQTGRKRKHEVTDDPSSHGMVDEWAAVPGLDSIPWFEATFSPTSSPAIRRLHEEICDFFSFVRPHAFEEAVRQDLIRKIEFAIRRCTVAGSRTISLKCFGSFAAGLYLPTADLDLVAVSPEYIQHGTKSYCQKSSVMFKLGNHLRSGERIAYNLIVIPKARVPILKFVDKQTGIKVDISFENDSGLRANQTFQTWKAEYPCMPLLVVLVKQLVAMHGLSEVANGGIGGFSIICLVVSMLQLLPQAQAGNLQAGTVQYGELLLNFLDLYGNNFNIRTTGISMRPPGYFDKIQRPLASQNPNRLTIIDPNNPSNDISGGSRYIEQVFAVFRAAHAQLERRLSQAQAGRIDGQSILGCVLAGNYSSFMEQRRRLYRIHYGSQMPRDRLPREDHHLQQGATSTPPESVMRHLAITQSNEPDMAAQMHQQVLKARVDVEVPSGTKKSKLAAEFKQEFPHIPNVPDLLNPGRAHKLLLKYGAGDKSESSLAQQLANQAESQAKIVEENRRKKKLKKAQQKKQSQKTEADQRAPKADASSKMKTAKKPTKKAKRAAKKAKKESKKAKAKAKGKAKEDK